LEKEIFNYAYENHNLEKETLMTVPGIEEPGATILIAEICNFKGFSSGD
jgi:transposase